MSVSIVVILDQSDSMRQLNYMGPAQTDASTFINVMNIGDNLGVVSFSDNATVVVGSSSSLVNITSQTTINTATSAVMALQPLSMTNMVAAFNTAAGMIASSAGARGEVFLSDGMWNVGGDPVPGLATTPPIYTIALGANGQQSTLQQIATKTGGTYNYAPNALQLAQIYNAISNQTSVANLVANAQPTVPQFKFTSTPGTVPSGSTQATFAVNWDDWSVQYTPNTPSGNQVNVFLTDPNGQTIGTTPTAIGNGYVVFKIPNPVAGTYTAYAWYSGPNSLAYTAGIFDNNRTLTMALAAPDDIVSAGSPAEVQVRLDDDGEPITGARLDMSLESPLVSLDRALSTHAARLDAIEVSGDLSGDAARIAQLEGLQQQTGENLLPRQEHPVTNAVHDGGVYRIPLSALETPGSHTLRVTAHGVSPSGTPFQRSSRISFIVS